MNQILSLKQYCNHKSHFHNIRIFYFPPNSSLIPGYDIFYYYFIIIDNQLYINDIEFDQVFSYFTTGRYTKETKEMIFNYNNLEKKEVDNGIFIKNLYTNAGHSFSNIIQQIHKSFMTFTNNIENISKFKIIITEDLYKYNAFIISCIMLFVSNENLVILKSSQILSCKNLIMYPDNSVKDDSSVEYLLDRLKITNLNKIQHENIFLIKSVNTQNTTPGAFNIEYNDFFIENGFVQIIPDTMNIIELYNIINNSKNIIMSWGCCSYLNSIFANECCNILILGHEKYKHEYDAVSDPAQYPNFYKWFPKKTYKSLFIDGLTSDPAQYFHKSVWFPEKTNKSLFIGDLTSELTVEIVDLLKHKLTKLV
tara:strand:- start:1200 stop:2297 length:1098 start_codon:yes stop_codon:yes gene_type:complete